MPKIKGIDFDFGGEVLTIPPLALGDFELLQERLGALQLGAADSDTVKTIVDAAYAALHRNYPAMSRADVAAIVDLGNMVDVIDAVMDVTGAKRKALDEKKAGAASG